MKTIDVLLLVINFAVLLLTFFYLSKIKIAKEHFKKKLAVPLLFVLAMIFAEIVATYMDASRGALLHVFILLAALFSPFFLKEDAKLAQAFIPASLLRIVNLGLPLHGIYIYYQLLLIYSLLFISAMLFIFTKNISLNEIGIKRISLKEMLIGIVLGVLFGFTEFSVLGMVKIMPKFLLASLGVFLILGTTEEIIFRGVLQKILEEVDVLASIVLSSIAFGAMHIIWRSPLEFFFVSYVGLVLAVSRYKTNSLGIPIVAHTIINFTLFQLIPFKTALAT